MLCNRLLIRALAGVAGLALASPLAMAQAPSPLTPAVVEPETEESDLKHLDQIAEKDDVDLAIERGLAWLVQEQDVTSGAFKGRLPCTYTALACMALMASGHCDGRSPYGEHLRRGILFLAREAQNKNGYLGGDGGRMYGHGIATLALCEAYGMLAKPEDNQTVRRAVDLAVKLILNSQAKNGAPAGGWRYEPTGNDADLSVTVWQILALRSAQNCKLEVPEAAVGAALDYVRRTYVEGQGFCYQPGGGASVPMRCAGVVCMKALGADKTPEDQKRIEVSGKILETVNPDGGGHYWYQSYYLATAANMMGDKTRADFLPKLEKSILRLQQPAGVFAQHSGYDGGVYSTSFALICLAVRYQYLPIYQE